MQIEIQGSFYVEHQADKGLCLFASRFIKSGELILCNYSQKIDETEYLKLKNTILWNKMYRSMEGQETLGYYICFGVAVLINHSDYPNVSKRFVNDGLCDWIKIESTRDISADEELVMKYSMPSVLGVE